MAVRSQQLGVGDRTTAGTSTVFTVPAGHRYIIKSVMVYNPQGVAETGCRLSITMPAGIQTIYQFPSIASASNAVLDLWWVLNSGDVLNITCTGAAIRWNVSGADLVE